MSFDDNYDFYNSAMYYNLISKGISPLEIDTQKVRFLCIYNPSLAWVDVTPVLSHNGQIFDLILGGKEGGLQDIITEHTTLIQMQVKQQLGQQYVNKICPNNVECRMLSCGEIMSLIDTSDNIKTGYIIENNSNKTDSTLTCINLTDIAREAEEYLTTKCNNFQSNMSKVLGDFCIKAQEK